jgi:hypothetical protein
MIGDRNEKNAWIKTVLNRLLSKQEQRYTILNTDKLFSIESVNLENCQKNNVRSKDKVWPRAVSSMWH